MYVEIKDVDNVLNLYDVDDEVISAVHDIPPAHVIRPQTSRWILDRRYQGRNKGQVFCAYQNKNEKKYFSFCICVRLL